MAGLNTNPLDRYTLTEMGNLWDDTRKLQMWAAVASVQAAAQSKLPPAEQVDWVRQLMEYPVPTPDEVRDVEVYTRHDVVAFLQLWRERMSPDHARSVHRGLTSSDLVDTALNATLGQVTDAILDAGDGLLVALAQASLRYWGTERLARTHGQPAEVTTLGFQLARHAVALMCGLHRLTEHMDDVMLFKMSGPVGTYRYTSFEQERRGAAMLGAAFKPAEVASQRLPREPYARWVSDLAILASSVEDLVLQIRLGQQFGVEEIAEPFASGQVGSSSMPHKRNPIRSETLTGLARVVRAQILPVMEGIATWNERDITHSSVERLALQTASTLTYYLLSNATALVEGLQVDASRMAVHIDRAGHRAYSASYKVDLVNAGIPPNEVDALVDGAIRDRRIGPDITSKLSRYSATNSPYVQPPMRVDHVRTIMEEMISGTSNRAR